MKLSILLTTFRLVSKNFVSNFRLRWKIELPIKKCVYSEESIIHVPLSATWELFQWFCWRWTFRWHIHSQSSRRTYSQRLWDSMLEWLEWEALVIICFSNIGPNQWLPASVARRNSRGDSAAREMRSAVVFLFTFFFFFYTILASTERSASAVKI